jgi:hypothetical protein
MSEDVKSFCPECDEQVEPADASLDRRGFIRVVTGRAASLLAVGGLAAAAPSVFADAPSAASNTAPVVNTPSPAENLVQELYAGLSAEQRRAVVKPWNHGATAGTALPTRQRFFNRAIDRQIGRVYTPAQQELCGRILREIASDDAGYAQLTRNGTFDASGAFENCGADIFGDPTTGQYAWVFSGHHITVRCDGNSVPGAAFGGPVYYGHSPDGYSQRNCFFYQTRAVMSVFDALNENQRRAAVVMGSPGELEPSVRFRAQGHPGISARELDRGQRQLVSDVMRTVLSPFRREDADEVMEIVRRNGGLERIHLAFYQDRGATDNARWHFWRLEGPGFVWNYRVLPHVHTYVNISSQV